MNEDKIHWKNLVNPNYLGAYSLAPGEDIILTIKNICQEEVTGPNNKKEVCVVAHFEEKQKPMILNKTNMKVITKLYKTPYIQDWSGKKIRIYATEVKFGKELVDALRIREIIPIIESDTDIICVDCNNIIMAFGKMKASMVAAHTEKTYNRKLCIECAKKLKNAKESENNAE